MIVVGFCFALGDCRVGLICFACVVFVDLGLWIVCLLGLWWIVCGWLVLFVCLWCVSDLVLAWCV